VKRIRARLPGRRGHLARACAVRRSQFPATISRSALGGSPRALTFASSTPGCSQGPSVPKRTFSGPAKAGTLTDTATVTAGNVSPDTDDTATATVPVHAT